MSKTPHIKLTKTMVDKYIIDAKVDVLKLFGVLAFPAIRSVEIFDPRMSSPTEYTNKLGKTTIRFYKTKRGDKRMSIKNLKNIASIGDYLLFTSIAGDAHTKAMTVTQTPMMLPKELRKVA